jgi:Zn-finger nucleic acid-binding protein
MSDPVICLRCGGALEAPTDPALAARIRLCECPQSSSEAMSLSCPKCGGSIKVGTRACPYCASTVATCRCAACLAWNLAGAAHCQRCGKPLHALQATSERATGCNCPRCGGKLAAREYAEMSVDECDGCGGLFLAPTMVEQLVAARDATTGLRLALPMRAISRETSVRYLNCPVCAKMMNRQQFGRVSGIVVDMCKAHGIWFDGGELAEALRFVEQGGLERARLREREELAERERRSRVDLIVGESSAGFGGDLEGSGFSRANNNGMFVELLRSIAKAWR